MREKKEEERKKKPHQNNKQHLPNRKTITKNYVKNTSYIVGYLCAMTSCRMTQLKMTYSTDLLTLHNGIPVIYNFCCFSLYHFNGFGDWTWFLFVIFPSDLSIGNSIILDTIVYHHFWVNMNYFRLNVFFSSSSSYSFALCLFSIKSNEKCSHLFTLAPIKYVHKMFELCLMFIINMSIICYDRKLTTFS